jgi:hypothetical protein
MNTEQYQVIDPAEITTPENQIEIARRLSLYVAELRGKTE